MRTLTFGDSTLTYGHSQENNSHHITVHGHNKRGNAFFFVPLSFGLWGEGVDIRRELAAELIAMYSFLKSQGKRLQSRD